MSGAEYLPGGEHLRQTMQVPSLTFLNEGQRLVKTNYWQTEPALRGFMFLSTNAGCVRLLVPASAAQPARLADMTNGVKEVILTRGRLDDVDEVTEVLFEDGTQTPILLHIDPKQVDRRWVVSDEGRRWRFAIYTQDRGKVADFARCYLRRTTAPLPYAQPWTGRRP